MSKTKIYHMGRQFRVYRNMAAVASVGIVLILMALVNMTGLLSAGRLVLTGVIAEAVILLVILAGGTWIQKNYSCQLDGRGLTLRSGSNEETYLWREFTRVWVDERGRNRPIVYEIGKRTLVINSFLETPGTLNREILEHIRSRVEIPEQLTKDVEALAAWEAKQL